MLVRQAPLSGVISHPTAARVSSAIVGKRSSFTQMMLILFSLWMVASHLFPPLYAILSPRRQVNCWATKSLSAHLLFLPLWTLDELQECRLFVTAFEEGLSSQSVTEAYEIAGGIPCIVLQLAAYQIQSGIPVEDLVLDILKVVVKRLESSLHRQGYWLLIVHG